MKGYFEGEQWHVELWRKEDRRDSATQFREKGQDTKRRATDTFSRESPVQMLVNKRTVALACRNFGCGETGEKNQVVDCQCSRARR